VHLSASNLQPPFPLLIVDGLSKTKKASAVDRLMPHGSDKKRKSGKTSASASETNLGKTLTLKYKPPDYLFLGAGRMIRPEGTPSILPLKTTPLQGIYSVHMISLPIRLTRGGDVAGL